MIAASGLVITILCGIVVVFCLLVDRGQRWVERVGGSAVFGMIGGAAILFCSLAWLVVKFLIAHAP